MPATWATRGWVALGGALGSLGRVGLTALWPATTSWVVWAELTVNTTGAFLLAVLVSRVEDPRVRAALGTGLLGSWTTVSALGTSVGTRMLDGALLPGATYAVVSVLLGLLAVAAGDRVATHRVAA